MGSISKIVLTGGPCAGKTTAMTWIKDIFSEKGYTVLFIPETATELISGGVAPWTCKSNYDYQFFQMQLQMSKEEIFFKAAATMETDRILIVCDRGQMDNKAYLSDEEFNNLIHQMNWDITNLKNRYDAVFHLTTAAKGAQEFYTTSNNSARTETVDEATALDDRIINAWMGHPYFRIIDNSTNFAGKMERLVKEIDVFLAAFPIHQHISILNL